MGTLVCTGVTIQRVLPTLYHGLELQIAETARITDLWYHLQMTLHFVQISKIQGAMLSPIWHIDYGRSTQTRLVCYLLINLLIKLNRSCTLVCDRLNIEDNWFGITLHHWIMNWLQKNRCYILLLAYVSWGIQRFWIYTHHWFFICSDQRLGIDYLYRYGNTLPIFGHKFVFL